MRRVQRIGEGNGPLAADVLDLSPLRLGLHRRVLHAQLRDLRRDLELLLTGRGIARDVPLLLDLRSPTACATLRSALSLGRLVARLQLQTGLEMQRLEVRGAQRGILAKAQPDQ